MSLPPITDAFQSYFELEIAQSASQLEEIFSLRHEVYVKEFAYEKEEEHPNGLERDAYDALSWHCLLRHKPSGRSSGCVRVVPGSKPGKATELPMERYCRSGFYDSPLRPDRAPRERICEFSRLAIHRNFRRRRGEQETPIGDTRSGPFPADQLRTFPLMAAGLFMAAAYLGNQNGKTIAYAMMEPRLAVLLARHGLQFTQIGEVVDYHGARAAYCIEREAGLTMIADSPILSALYLMVEEQIADKTTTKKRLSPPSGCPATGAM